MADVGGYTLFSRTGLKVVPQRRQMLFFGYKLNPRAEGERPKMDNGHTEHTGCPLREGRKWIVRDDGHARSPTQLPQLPQLPQRHHAPKERSQSATPAQTPRPISMHANHGLCVLGAVVCRQATMWYREGMTEDKGWEAYRGS